MYRGALIISSFPLTVLWLGSKIQSKYTHGLQDKKRSKSRLFGWFSNTLKPLTLSLWAFFQPSFRLFESVRKILPKAFESKSTICILYQLCRCVFKKRDFLPFCKFPWDRRKGIFFAFNLEFDLLEFFFLSESWMRMLCNAYCCHNPE